LRLAVAWLAALVLCCVASAEPALETPGALSSFIDGAMAAEIANGTIVGAVVAVVKDGETWLVRGYGLADRERGVPVDANGTLFRVGSVSKLFVWIAVMQQWQAGRLALDVDVNQYLDEPMIPGTFPQPITLTHLMTHTPGFEDLIIGLFAREPPGTDGFHRNLLTMLPRRVFPPGEVAAYSNYGTALAANLVERTAHVVWDDYVRANILSPLGMTSTTTQQPPPEPLDAALAHGYRYDAGHWQDVPFEFVSLPPAGSVSTTGPDMARLLLAFLAQDDGPVLTATTRSKLFERGFANDPRLNAMLFGLYEQSSHGQRIVGHLGDTEVFHAAFLLYPEQNLGLFAAFNSDRGTIARDGLVRAFADRWFGAPALPHPTTAKHDLARYAGWYRPLRVPESTPAKLLSMLGAVRVDAVREGAVDVRNERGVQRYYPIEADLLQSADGAERIVFGNAHGTATLFFDSVPFLSFERASWVRNPTANALLLLVLGVVFVSALVNWPGATFRRRRTRVPVPGEKRATVVAVLQMSACLVYFIAIAAMPGDNPNSIVYGLPAWFELARWIPVGVMLVLLLQARYTYLAWAEAFWWLGRRIHYTLTWLGGMAFVAWCTYWNLVPPAFAV
jgi:CubicO group peptidase (beta-lactamase class C family)